MDKHRAAGIALAIAASHKQGARTLRLAGQHEAASAVHRVGDVFEMLAARCCTDLHAAEEYSTQQAFELRLEGLQMLGEGIAMGRYLTVAADQLCAFTQRLQGEEK